MCVSGSIYLHFVSHIDQALADSLCKASQTYTLYTKNIIEWLRIEPKKDKTSSVAAIEMENSTVFGLLLLLLLLPLLFVFNCTFFLRKQKDEE